MAVFRLPYGRNFIVGARNAGDHPGKVPAEEMIRVLFVCLGNICRSPMAEAVFLQKVRDAGLEEMIEADSAGTGQWHIGEPAHSGTRKMLASKGVPYDGRARLLRADDLNRFDYVL